MWGRHPGEREDGGFQAGGRVSGAQGWQGWDPLGRAGEGGLRGLPPPTSPNLREGRFLPSSSPPLSHRRWMDEGALGLPCLPLKSSSHLPWGAEGAGHKDQATGTQARGEPLRRGWHPKDGSGS